VSGQLNLLAPPSEGPLAVPICRSVLSAGSRAVAAGKACEPLFPHRHAPPRPSAIPDDLAWLAALDFAEQQLRFRQAGRAVLDLRRGGGKDCTGGQSGPNSPLLMASSRGIEVDGASATWPQLLKGREEQRDTEFDVAWARDLAEAYHCLDYYGRVYGEVDEKGSSEKGYSPVPLIRRLAEEAIELGGKPGLLTIHTTYMRRGIGEALR
jgi:hypothetical protein